MSELAWSFSRINDFRACPYMLWAKSIAPKHLRIPFEQTEAMKAGSEVDDALTARIGSNTALPPKYQCYEPLAQQILVTPGTKLTQCQLALNAAFQPCGYKDWDNAWVRVIYDVAVIDGTYAFLGDWKNGQIRIDKDQLRLFALVAFHTYLELETVDTSYIWLKHGITTDETFTRSQVPELWDGFFPDVDRMQLANRSNNWAKTPSTEACKWCPVNKLGQCEKAAVKFGKSR